jgi:hypothetical protein
MDPADGIRTELAARLRSEIFGWLIAACICAFGGYYYYSELIHKEKAIYAAFVWTLRLAAPAFGAGAVLAVLGLSSTLILDIVGCGVLSPVLIGTSIACFFDEFYVDGLVLGVAGFVAARAAVRSWREFRVWRETFFARSAHQLDTVQTPQSGNAKPVWQESACSESSTPAPPEEAPPEGGYLAELGRQKD